MHANINEILERSERPFDVLEAFAGLNSRRKMLICDHLFFENRAAFQQTVGLLWPEATAADMRKLEKFLYSLKKMAH